MNISLLRYCILSCQLLYGVPLLLLFSLLFCLEFTCSLLSFSLLSTIFSVLILSSWSSLGPCILHFWLYFPQGTKSIKSIDWSFRWTCNNLFDNLLLFRRLWLFLRCLNLDWLDYPLGRWWLPLRFLDGNNRRHLLLI